MSVKIVIDMNLSPDWVAFLGSKGWTAIHWMQVGDPRAPDRAIMDWAVANAHVVFTHELDFGTMLALTHASGPSVLQVRGQNILPDRLGTTVTATLKQYESELIAGALIVVEVKRQRVRILPL